MSENLEDCVRRIEVSGAVLAEQVRNLIRTWEDARDTMKESAAATQAMISSFFDRQAEIKMAVDYIQEHGCKAEDLKGNKERMMTFDLRLGVLEAKKPGNAMHGMTWKLWMALGTVAGLMSALIGQSAAGPLIVQLLQKFLGGT